MKVKFKYGIRTFSGTVDEMTYGSFKKGKVCIGRRWVMPRLTDNNAALGSAAVLVGLVNVAVPGMMSNP